MKTPRELLKISTSAALRHTRWMVAGCGIIGLIAAPARGQFGIDTAALIAALTGVNSTMQAVMQAPMLLMQQMTQQQSDFNSNTLYPASGIAAAQNQSSQSLASAQQGQQLMDSPISSAQLSANQQLESALLSRDPNQVSNVSSLYAGSYGTLPATNTATQQAITTIDMGDATAQESYKEAIVLDALADREMEVSQQLLTQLQSSAPGNAPVVTAQAAAWLLQGHGYSQAAMAQILRAQGAVLGYEGSGLKQGSTMNQNVGGAIFAVPVVPKQ
jgi:hypothetical protein